MLINGLWEEHHCDLCISANMSIIPLKRRTRLQAFSKPVREQLPEDAPIYINTKMLACCFANEAIDHAVWFNKIF